MTIKSQPEDFVVEEVLRDGVLSPGRGAYAVYRLTKENLTTPAAVSRAAKELGVSVGSVSHAGLKDRHARTVQHISVKRGAGEVPKLVQAEQMRLELAGWMDKPLGAWAIDANRFEVVLRSLSWADVAAMDAAMAALANPTDKAVLRIVNYFGDQRFGSARGGEFIARMLIRADFEGALRQAIAITDRKDPKRVKQFKRICSERWGDWRGMVGDLPDCPLKAPVARLAEGGDFATAFAGLPHLFQFMCVQAYQSHLWNRTAFSLVSARCPRERLITADDPYGALAFPAFADLPSELADLEMPVLGHASQLSEPWQQAAQAVLAAEGLTVYDLRIPRFRRPVFGEAPRRLCVNARGVQADAPVEDKRLGRISRVLRFELPRGSYATVLLRSLGQ